MGTMIQAVCECGFKSKEILAGGGFRDFMRVLKAPALCMNCYTFSARNYLNKYNYCRKCKTKLTFYNDKSLWKDKNASTEERKSIFYWDTFILPNTLYLCPKCREFKMTFEFGGMWD